MSSRVLSRLLPGAAGDDQPSVYESLRQMPSRARQRQDLEARAARSPVTPFRDDDEDDDPDAFLYDGQPPSEVGEGLGQSPEMRHKRRTEEDDDVPESLLLEEREIQTQNKRDRRSYLRVHSRILPLSGGRRKLSRVCTDR